MVWIIGIVNIAVLFCDQTILVFCSWTFDSAANGPPSWPFHIINLTNCSFIPSDMIFSLEENVFFWLPICCFDVDKLPPRGWNPCASVNVWSNPVQPLMMFTSNCSYFWSGCNCQAHFSLIQFYLGFGICAHQFLSFLLHCFFFRFGVVTIPHRAHL